MILGFTGTRDAMTADQAAAVAQVLAGWAGSAKADGAHPGTLVHGDCRGADEQAHEIARVLGFMIELYPSTITSMRAHSRGAAIEYTPAPPLERNRRIAERCGLLIAAPATAGEILRSGTWATVRYARALGRPVMIVQPSGNIVAPFEVG